MPLSETKWTAAHIGGAALNLSIGFTLYGEETEADFSVYSGNVSLGIGVGTLGMDKPLSMGGFFVHAYPLYEFPVFTARDSIAPWKTALDVGYALDLGADRLATEMASLYISFYSRLIGAFADTGGGTTFHLNWPDFGIAVGTHVFYQSSKEALP